MQKQSALLSKLAAVHRGSGRPALSTCRNYRSSLPPKYLVWGHAPFPALQNGSVNANYRGRLSSETLPTWPTPVRQRGLAVGASGSEHTKDSPAAVKAQKDEEKQALPEIILRPWQEGIESAGQPLAQTAVRWQARIAAYARTSFLSAYAAFVDNTLVALLQALRLDDLFRRATPWLEDRLAALTGTWHRMADGRKMSYSLVNNTSPDFSIPRQYSAPIVLDEGAADLSKRWPAAGYRPALAHFLSLCMKLVYEKEDVMQDTVETKWGLRFHNYFHTGTETFIAPVPECGGAAPFVPRTRAALLGSPHALVLVFRGSEPTNLINLRSSGRISMTERKGLGRVHDGFYGALFHNDEESGVLFDKIVKAIEAADPEGTKALYVTGHSLGAALSLLFAQVAACRKPAIADRIAAIYGFAPPRVGDAEFADHVSAAFCATSSPGPNRAFRVCHGADIICRLPPRMLQYADAGQEVFVTSTGRVLFDPKEVKRWHNIEGWGFVPLYLYKLVAGVFDRREKLLRSLYRVFLLVTFPGLTDHWPADYEGKLRKALIREVEGQSRSARKPKAWCTMQATFGRDGELKAKGKDAAPAVAEGLGTSNIKGVEDSKTKTDIAHESGHDIVHDTPMTEKGMKPAYDPGSNTQGVADHATLPEGQPRTLGHNN